MIFLYMASINFIFVCLSISIDQIYNCDRGEICIRLYDVDGRCGGLKISALDSGVSGPGSSPGPEHYVVFLGKTFYSHSTSLHPGV